MISSPDTAVQSQVETEGKPEQETAAHVSTLVKIDWSKEDKRTEQEKAGGMPQFNFEGTIFPP